MADPGSLRMCGSANERAASFIRRARSLSFRALLPAAAGLALTAAAAVLSTPALAFDIHGKVVNGTTGKPVAGIAVNVVDPRHGMATEEEIQTDSEGTFKAKDLEEENSVYLVQATYGGITYTEIVQPEGAKAHVDLRVYETTTSWDSVGISLPHLMARRTADTLSVDRIFVVSNRTDPPRTVHGEGAWFRLYIPEEKLQITSLFATSLGIPISVAPHPTDTPGIYTINFPFKPGETQVGISFDVGYRDARYAYAEPLQYPLEEVVVMTEDPDMDVTSDTVELGEPEDVRGFKARRLTSLPRSSTLALTFRGGRSVAPSASSVPDHEIITLAEPWQNASIILITAFFLLLVLVMAYVARSPMAEADETAYLTLRKGAIATQIARLDDLFATGTVSDQLYRARRGELVEVLARVLYRIEAVRPGKSKAARQGKGTTHAR